MAIRLLCLGLLLLSGPVRAVLPGAAPYRYHARQWSVEQGLPQVTVTALVVDKRGFVWAGTQNGLARFDGTRFRTFDVATYPLLLGNHINALAVDDAGRLWVGTNKGLSAYIDGRFVKLPPVPHGMGETNTLAASADGVWIAAEHGLFHIDKGRLRPHAVDGWADREADSVAVSPQGGLCVAVKGGIYARPAGHTKFDFYPLPDKTLSIHALAWFRGHVWVGTSAGLYTTHGQRLQAAQPRLAKRSIRALLTGPSRHLWIGTDASVFRLDERGRLIDLSVNPGLQDKWIWSLTSDRVGDVWIGTATQGVIRLWDNHVISFGRASGLTSSLVTTIYRDRDGSVLVGAKDGVYRYRNGAFHHIHGQQDMPNPLVHSFLRRRNGQLWIGTIGGLAIMQSHRRVRLPRSLAPLAHAVVYNLRQDRDGTIWIGTTRGLFRYRDHHLQRFGKQDGLAQEFVRGTYRADGGPLWVGTTHGLFQRVHGRFHRLCAAEHLDGQALDILRDAHGTVWITQADGSLFSYAAGRCQRYAFKSGPLSGSIYYVTQGRDGKLWLTNDRGIYRIAASDLQQYAATDAPRTPERVIQRADGLHQIHPVGGTPQSGLLDDDENFWVPTINGIVVIGLDHPPSAATPSPVVIENITRNSQTLALAHTPAHITLAPGRNDLRIDYAALDYRAPEAVRYRYRLSGYDSHWVDAGARQEALYTHLPPGRYTFEVRTATPGGATSAQKAVLNLTLRPFFYQTRWFDALLIVLAACLVYGIYSLRMRRLRAQRIRLKTLVATRTEELRQANRKLRQASMTDHLTGLGNRRFFVDAVKKDVAALRRGASPDTDNALVFLILDLDDFKRVNDAHGHQAGDAVLMQLGQLLRDTVRASDDVIRWGGEEFLIVARHTERNHAATLAENLRHSIASHAFRVNDDTTTACTCSIGFCAYPLVPGTHDHPGWEGTINLADAALYQAKHRGKNRWVGVRPTEAALATDPQALSPQLNLLLEKGLATLEVSQSTHATHAP